MTLPEIEENRRFHLERFMALKVEQSLLEENFHSATGGINGNDRK